MVAPRVKCDICNNQMPLSSLAGHKKRGHTTCCICQSMLSPLNLPGHMERQHGHLFSYVTNALNSSVNSNASNASGFSDATNSMANLSTISGSSTPLLSTKSLSPSDSFNPSSRLDSIDEFRSQKPPAKEDIGNRSNPIDDGEEVIREDLENFNAVYISDDALNEFLMRGCVRIQNGKLHIRSKDNWSF